jgi:hypothetical protein
MNTKKPDREGGKPGQAVGSIMFIVPLYLYHRSNMQKCAKVCNDINFIKKVL